MEIHEDVGIKLKNRHISCDKLSKPLNQSLKNGLWEKKKKRKQKTFNKSTLKIIGAGGKRMGIVIAIKMVENKIKGRLASVKQMIGFIR